MGKSISLLWVVNIYPSPYHPYIELLIESVKKNLPNLEILILNKKSSIENQKLSKPEKKNKKLLFRFALSSNPLDYFLPFLSIPRNLTKFRKLIKRFKKDKSFDGNIWKNILNYHFLLNKTYDQVYFTSIHQLRLFPAWIFFPNAKILTSLRGQDIDFFPNLYQSYIPKINRLHVISGYLRTRAQEIGFDPKIIHLIFPAFLPPKDEPSSKEKKRNFFQLLSVSRLFWTKGHVYAIRAIHLLNLSGIHIKYIIAGDGPSREFLELEVRRLNLEAVVKFLGRVSQEKVNNLMIESDLFVHLSLEEGFNNSVLTSQYFKTPCLVSNVGGLPENVKDYETGRVVSPFNAVEVNKTMKELLLDKENRKRMGEKGHERALKTFGFNDYLDNFLKFLSTFA